MLEIYEAYTDYRDMMDLTESLVSETAERVLGSMRVEREGKTIDLAPPWCRRSMTELIEEHAGVNIELAADLESLRAAVEQARVPGLDPSDAPSWATLVDDLFSKTVEPDLFLPTFVVDYPVDLSPLAKRSQENPQLVERFEAFIGGMELVNAFSELNDPDDQRERFAAQAEAGRQATKTRIRSTRSSSVRSSTACRLRGAWGWGSGGSPWSSGRVSPSRGEDLSPPAAARCLSGWRRCWALPRPVWSG